ncbi:MAG TPA: hypothetical protein VIF62_28010 [Labilithrix sp.]
MRLASVAAASLLALSARDARAEDAWPVVEVTAPLAPGAPALETRAVNGWLRTACVPPCSLRLDPSAQYRISGAGIVDSDPFVLPRGAERVHVDVAAGSTVLRDVGTIFSVGGLLFAAGGGTILLLPPANGATREEKTNQAIVGVGFLTMGVLTAALGIGLRLLSDTSVRTTADSN